MYENMIKVKFRIGEVRKCNVNKSPEIHERMSTNLKNEIHPGDTEAYKGALDKTEHPGLCELQDSYKQWRWMRK